ncbi:hypothetical protein TEA_029236 [Camellia sinensis var. sinensis]|uniref:Uncharacterized protein n=1 Tax=Camellia sinensis var. sinensis TaxID=542762 RepID=A0A4S4DN06_CAMSN|nr:hypothetical protein TEA_029236 [Camellia sinensis var. sinensis]
MSLLDQPWDDTVAGPRPENGLGKLRKQHTFTVRPSKDSEGGGAEEGMRVTRSIMILKPPPAQNGSPPVSPAGSTPSPSSTRSPSQCVAKWKRGQRFSDQHLQAILSPPIGKPMGWKDQGGHVEAWKGEVEGAKELKGLGTASVL